MFSLRGGLGGTLIECLVLGGARHMEASACPGLTFIEISSWKLLEAAHLSFPQHKRKPEGRGKG